MSVSPVACPRNIVGAAPPLGGAEAEISRAPRGTSGASVSSIALLVFAALVVAHISATLAVGCGARGPGPGSARQAVGADERGGAEPGPGPLALPEVRYWAYQLQGLSDPGAVDALARSRYDMLVLEPTRTDFTGESGFDTRGMVSRLKAGTAHDGHHRKLVLAYLDIGQAEDWRWYWTWSKRWPTGAMRPKDWPDYIVGPDPDGWEGNYTVEFWRPEWKQVIIHGLAGGAERGFDSALDEVLDDGFDGVYLDWVEAFEDPNVAAAASRQRLSAAQEMLTFIEQIRRYGRARDPGFLVVQQNAAHLSEHGAKAFRVIDAIAQECVFYEGETTDAWSDPEGYDKRVEAGLTAEYVRLLTRYQDSALPVFNVEYSVRRARDAYAWSRELGYVPYCSRRSLSRVSSTPPWD